MEEEPQDDTVKREGQPEPVHPNEAPDDDLIADDRVYVKRGAFTGTTLRRPRLLFAELASLITSFNHYEAPEEGPCRGEVRNHKREREERLSRATRAMDDAQEKRARRRAKRARKTRAGVC